LKENNFFRHEDIVNDDISKGDTPTDDIPIDNFPTNDIPNVATVSNVEPRQVSAGKTTTNAAHTSIKNNDIQIQVCFGILYLSFFT
jgi:hypothetical protein